MKLNFRLLLAILICVANNNNFYAYSESTQLIKKVLFDCELNKKNAQVNYGFSGVQVICDDLPSNVNSRYSPIVRMEECKLVLKKDNALSIMIDADVISEGKFINTTYALIVVPKINFETTLKFKGLFLTPSQKTSKGWSIGFCYNGEKTEENPLGCFRNLESELQVMCES